MDTPLRILSSMATRGLLADLAAASAAATGLNVTVESVGGVTAHQRVLAGEALDVVVLASEAMAALQAAGRLVPGSWTGLVRSGIHAAVAAGAAQPDLRDGEAVKRAVRQARSVAYSTGPSGVHLVSLFQRWGVAEEVAARTVQAPPGVPVGALIASGQVALGFQQLSELMGLPGIMVVGPLPPDIQRMTVFAGGVAASSTRAEAAQAWLSWAASPATAPLKRRHGLEDAARA